MNTTQSRNRTALAALIALAVVGGVTYSVSAWTAPLNNPPAGNVTGPVTTGGTAQTKIGTLGVSQLFTSGYGAIPSGWSGVHTWDVWAKASIRANMFCIGGGTALSSTNTGNCITAWPSGTTYTAGAGLTLSATKQFSINAPTTCTTGLTWNGSSFTCAAGSGAINVYEKEQTYSGNPSPDLLVSCNSGDQLVSAQNFRESPLLTGAPFGDAKLVFKTALSGEGAYAAYCGPDSTYSCVLRISCLEN